MLQIKKVTENGHVDCPGPGIGPAGKRHLESVLGCHKTRLSTSPSLSRTKHESSSPDAPPLSSSSEGSNFFPTPRETIKNNQISQHSEISQAVDTGPDDWPQHPKYENSPVRMLHCSISPQTSHVKAGQSELPPSQELKIKMWLQILSLKGRQRKSV